MNGILSKTDGGAYRLSYALNEWFDCPNRKAQERFIKFALVMSDFSGAYILGDAEKPGDIGNTVNFVFATEEAAKTAEDTLRIWIETSSTTA